MKQIKWFSCGISNAITRTVIHFFPSAGIVTAPYPALCKIGIFGIGIEHRWVTIEGARVSHPDGVRAEELFPELRQGVNGFFGITIEVSTNQPTANLSGSKCIVEFASKGQGLKFHAIPWVEAKRDYTRSDKAAAESERVAVFAGLLGIDDEQTVSSLVLINSSDDAWSPEILAPSQTKEQKTAVPTPIQVLPRTTQEVPLSSSTFAEVEPWVSSVGAVRAGAFYCSKEPWRNLGAYTVCRDRMTKRLVSVCAV